MGQIGKSLLTISILCGLTLAGSTGGQVWAQSPPAIPVPSTFFGMHVVYSPDWPTVPIGDLGYGGMVGVSYIEQTKGVYDWARLDAYVATANAHNVPFQWALDQAPPWAVTDQSSCHAGALPGILKCTANVTDMTEMTAFFTALTQRYNGSNGHGFIAAYNLYVEPENFYTGTAANLATQTSALAAAVRANSPNALVVGLGVTYPDTYYAPGGYMDAYWAAGGVKTLDAVCFHGYAHHSNDVPEIVNTYVPYIKAALARNGIPASTPIWDTEGSWGDVMEAGWNITNPDQQAAWLARSYLLHWSDGVARFDWYGWDSTNWGQLWFPGAGITTAGIAYNQVYNWMVGRTMTTPCTASGTVWHCDFAGAGEYVARAVWDTSGPSTYTPPAGTYAHYLDLAGVSTTLGASVTIGSKPILLEGTASVLPPKPPTGLTATVN
jgi:hypothetical protein